jgi:hypothetical protein
MTQPFKGALAKLQIASLDEKIQVEAQYNPRELQLDIHVPWAKHDVLGSKRPKQDAAASRGQRHIEFTGADSRSLSLELLFDGFETGKSIEPFIETLEALASVRDAQSPDPKLRRPHRCIVVWGDRGLRPFRCVIESVSVKYTMFDRNGTPLRASCSVKLMEADILETSSGEQEQYSGVRRKS